MDDVGCAGRADAARCLVAEGVCVACVEGSDCTSANAPVCDVASHECRGCAAHTECSSELCDDSSGTCVAEESIIYLAPAGQDAGTCTRSEPCGSFARGLALVSEARNIIKAAPGMYTGQIVIDGIKVVIYADGSTAQPAAENQSVISVTNGADATIEGLTITLARGPTLPVAVTCTGITSTLRLHGAAVLGNTGGGLSINQCEFSMVNNVIVLNGGPTTPIGGVEIGGITTVGLHEFAFNTVTGNASVANEVAGVRCGVIAVPLEFSNNIVYDNQVSGTGTQVGGDADCSWTYSDIGPQGVDGEGNINMDPLFVNPEERDFHLQPGSPAKDAADPAATNPRDIDNDLRPNAGRSDMGADESVE